MPTVNFQRIDLDCLYPPFLEKLLDVIAKCEARGARYIAISGFRTYGEQMALWAKGRTVANVDATPAKPLGNPVTNAKGGQSAHNFGVAVDFAFDKDLKRPGLQPGWALADYKILIEEVERAGLHSGHGYRDHPHVSWPGLITATDLVSLRARWEDPATQKMPMLVDRLREIWKVL